MGVSFFMIAYVSRYLGPTNIGNLSYAQSFVALFLMFATLGITNIFYRDLIAHPERENEILGTALAVKLFFGTITAIITTIVGYMTNSDHTLTLLIAILSLAFIVEPLSITVHVFTARALSKYATIVQMGVTVTVQLLKLLLIFLGKGIVFFAAITVLEIALGACMAMYYYCRTLKQNPLHWTFNPAYARTLTFLSLPILFAGVSNYIFSRIDQVMLMHMSNAVSVGLYQSAVQITELLGNLIPGIIIASLTPALINARKGDGHEYFHRMRQLLIFVGVLSLIIDIGIYFCSSIIIHILYGSAFLEAGQVLRIYIWSSLIYIFIIILQQHLINDNRTITFFFLSASTAGCNIVLNLFLIPIYGGAGAAAASVFSLCLYLLLPLLHPQLRRDYARIFGFLP